MVSVSAEGLELELCDVNGVPLMLHPLTIRREKILAMIREKYFMRKKKKYKKI